MAVQSRRRAGLLTENTVCVEESVCELGDVELDAATCACEGFGLSPTATISEGGFYLVHV